MRKKHISTEIFTYVLIGFLLLIFLLCGGFLRYLKNILQEKINTSIMVILNQTSNSVNDALDRTESLAHYFRVNTTLIDAFKKSDYEASEVVDDMFSDLGNSQMWTGEYITILGKNDHIFVNWENDGEIRYSQGMKALKKRLFDENDTLHNLQFERLVGYQNLDKFDKNKKLVGVVSYIYNDARINEEIGIITVGIPEKSILSIMRENKIYDGSQICIIDRDSNVLLSTAPEMNGTTIDMSQTGWNRYAMTAGECLLDYQGSQMMVFYQPLDTNLLQMVMIPYQIYMKEIKMLLLTLVGIMILAVGMAFLIAIAISYSISKPIKELEQSIHLITKGDLRGRVNVIRTDDLGMLGVHFNVMVDNLEHLIEEKVENQKRTSELVIANKTAELKMLHAQINPHFLFNTLNSIRCLAIINKADYIARMLESLGALLENSIMKGKENTSIGREVTLMKKYIELQQMRYGKRLKAEFLVDEAIYFSEISRFMLQPLIENAIIHGLADKIEGGSITVRGNRQDGMIYLEVEDNGVGVDETKLQEKEQKTPVFSKHGIGLSNIRERLILIYGERCGLEIGRGRNGKGTKVILTFPDKPFKGDDYA